MTPEEAHRHEWFSSTSPVRSLATTSSPSTSSAPPPDSNCSTLSSSCSGPTLSSSKIPVAKPKKTTETQPQQPQQQQHEASQRKRVDGNSNLDDSGTFLPSILWNLTFRINYWPTSLPTLTDFNTFEIGSMTNLFTVYIFRTAATKQGNNKKVLVPVTSSTSSRLTQSTATSLFWLFPLCISD